MMTDYGMDVRPALGCVAIMVFALWGAWELVDYFWIDEVIESKTILVPEIKLEINNNVVDTIYVYRVQ
jgi:hypothetical protein